MKIKYFNGEVHKTSSNARITKVETVKAINTLNMTCCKCKGHGETCEKGGAWIYCTVRSDYDHLFDGDSGELVGCNAFHK